jgi:V8-like Glu-specific endopeptidase
MMMYRSLMIALVLLTSAVAHAGYQKVIYGDDNRLDYFEVGDTALLELANSTAAMMSVNSLNKRGSITEITGTSLGRAYNLCLEEPFRHQPIAGDCSGFLVGPKTMVTAGHCITSNRSCKNARFVFDYKVSKPGQTKFKVPTSNVYKCKKLINSVLSDWDGDGNDYAVVELDREVTDRKPLSFRKEGEIADGRDLVIIGYPWGLPVKIAAGAYVMNNDHPIYFSASLDSFQGNSGSAVFNMKTGEIEGILVRGAADLKRKGACNISNVCTEDSCTGEEVTRITSIPEIMGL